MKIKFILFSTLLFCSNILFAQNFSKTPYIGSDGVMEVGKYIDFHSTDAGTSDYDARLQADQGMLSLTGGSLFLNNTETVNGWDYTHLFWSGHSLVMGSPVGYYKYNRIELKPGGSSLGLLKSELFMYSTNTDYTSDLKIKLSTTDPSYILGNLGINTSDVRQALSVAGHVSITSSDADPDEGYNGNLMITKSTASGQYINFVRQASTAWSLGTVYNSNTFAIGQGTINDASFTSPFLSITTGGAVGIATATPQAKLEVDADGDPSNIEDNATNGLLIKGSNQMLYMGACSSSNTSYIQSVKSGAFTPLLLNARGGNVGINTANPQYSLDVYGTIRAKEVLVDLNGTADFVFKDSYKLKPIQEVYNYAKENKHLPDIPSEAEVVKTGMNMGDFQVKLLQKVEELTLYVAQQDRTIKEQQDKINQLEEKINK